MSKFQDSPSFLSPNVKRTLCDVGLTNGPPDECCIQDHHLDFSYLSALLPDPEKNADAAYYHQCVRLLAPVFKKSRLHLQSLKTSEFWTVYEEDLQWTSSPKLALECFEYLLSDDDVSVVLSLLLVTALLERSLGDVYLMKGSQCPSMLKDLLVTAELEGLLGKYVVQILRIVIGPPISLNIRNVMWHGFPTPGEIPIQYGFFLMLMTVSIGHVLKTLDLQPVHINHRPWVQFPQACLFEDSFPAASFDAVIFKDIMEATGFFPRVHKPFLHKAVQKYKEGSYGECLVLLFPQMEHGLRCAFAQWNNCEERIMTAESTVLYTTFDEILNPTLPDRSENKLLKHLGDQHLQMLYDILSYPEGLRLRDRVSHGEVELDTVSESLARHVMSIIGILCLQTVKDSTLILNSSVQCLLNAATKYAAVFHPLSYVRRQITECVEKLSEWLKLPRPSIEQLDTSLDWEKLQSESALESFDVFNMAVSSSNGELNVQKDTVSSVLKPFQIIADSLNHYMEGKSPLLYRSQSSLQSAVPSTDVPNSNKQEISVSEVTGLLRRITSSAILVSDNVCSVTSQRFSQWQAKELRSRQRNTYKRHLDSIPVISVGLRLILLTVVSVYRDLDVWSEGQWRKRQELTKLLKFMNQYCENLVTFSSSDKNRWDEACNLTEKMISKVASSLQCS